MSYDILLTDFNLRINDKMMDGINIVYTVTCVYRKYNYEICSQKWDSLENIFN